jgi:hypothetical protein
MVPSKIDSPIWGMMTSVGMNFLPLARVLEGIEALAANQQL